MWLKCPCGNKFPLAKHLGSEWYTPRTHIELDEWFVKHALCDDGAYPARPALEYELDIPLANPKP
jgi:hypothetical protein